MSKENLIYTEALIEYVEAHLAEDINVETLAKAGFVSRAKLYRDFYNVVGHSIKEYIRKRRLSNALVLVKKSELPLADIAYLWGYSSQQQFSRLVQRKLNMTPMEYKKSDRYYYFPRYLGDNVFDVSVEHITIPKLQCFYFYSSKLAGLERRAIKALLDLLPDYSGKIFGRNGKQRNQKFCYEISLSVEADQAKCLEKAFEVGKQIEARTGLFAMTTVKNQEEVINAAWEYIDKTWLTHSMYQYGDEGYFEEYIVHLGKPHKLKLYLSVMPKKEYPCIRLAHLEQQAVIAANAKGANAERKAANAVIGYFEKHYPRDLKYINKFYVRQFADSFVYGIFTEEMEEYPEERALIRKMIPQGIYLILEGESVGDYHIFKRLLTSFATENSLQINDEEIFGIYYTDYGFRNPRLSLFAAVNIETK